MSWDVNVGLVWSAGLQIFCWPIRAYQDDKQTIDEPRLLSKYPYVRSADRNSANPVYRSGDLGFRAARTYP